MIILSWDVGVIHLAYCILEYIEKTKNVRILDWNNINLIDDDRIDLVCSGKTKKGKCNKKARYYLPEETGIGFCKTHLSQSSNYWSEKKIRKLFISDSSENYCGYLQKTENKCGKKSKYYYKTNNIHYCTSHYNSELKKCIKKSSPQPIKNIIVKKYPTAKLQLNLINKMDELAKHFASLGIEEVIIENQPAKKHAKMKSIANTLFDYFMIRGHVDKSHGLNINLVKFISPSNKLKVNNENTIEVLGKNEDKKYKMTKALGIQYTKKLLENDHEQLEYLDFYKKKDDLCDAYLQGLYYLLFVKNSPEKKPGSKSSKKKKTKRKNSKKKSKNTGSKKKKSKSAHSKKKKSGSKSSKKHTIRL